MNGAIQDGVTSAAQFDRLLPHKLRQLYADFEENVGDYLKVYKLIGERLLATTMREYVLMCIYVYMAVSILL